MTVQWLPDSRREIPARDYSMAQLVVGTAAPIGAPNWVGVYQVFLHCDLDDEHEQDLNVDDVERFEGIAHNFRDVAPLMQRHSRFMTGGPVLRVRPMPSRPQLLAVRTRTSPDTLLVDFSRRRAEPEEGNTSPSPDLLLKGHRGSGRAMAWCEQVASRLATGGADNLVNVYWLGSLVEGAGRGGTTIQQPGMTLRGHTDVIDDISWHGSHGAVLSSCSRAGELILWDLRASKQDVQHERPHGSAPVYTTQFHPTAHFMLATGGADNTTRVWDIRKFKEPCAALVGHSDAVRGVEWAPFNETVLLSYSADGSTRCWDLAKRFSGATQQSDDTRDARASLGDDRVCSADLVFTHAGHTAGVREAAWAPFPEDEWTVASVCDNNMLQLWTPHPDTYNDEVVCEEDEDVT
jgi:histone-binding protein RBBP4